jgi:hypothetical protein
VDYPSIAYYPFLTNICNLHGRLLKHAIHIHPPGGPFVFSRKAVVADSTEKPLILDSLASAFSNARVEVEKLRGEPAQHVVNILFDVRECT